MVDFGNTLKRLRRKNDMTQEQLSRRLGLTKSVISAYETGMRMPSYDVLIAIARIFKVTTDFLLGVEQKQEVDFSGLTEAEKAAIAQYKAHMQRIGDPCVNGVLRRIIRDEEYHIMLLQIMLQDMQVMQQNM